MFQIFSLLSPDSVPESPAAVGSGVCVSVCGWRLCFSALLASAFPCVVGVCVSVSFLCSSLRLCLSFQSLLESVLDYVCQCVVGVCVSVSLLSSSLRLYFSLESEVSLCVSPLLESVFQSLFLICCIPYFSLSLYICLILSFSAVLVSVLESVCQYLAGVCV